MKKSHLSWLILTLAIVLIAWVSISQYIMRSGKAGSDVDIEQVVRGHAGQAASQDVPDLGNVTVDRPKQFDVAVDKAKLSAVITFKDGTIVNVPIYWEDWEYYDPELRIVDVNFDGHDDLMLSYSAGAYNMSTRFYAQDPHTRAFAAYEIDNRPRDPKDPYVTDYNELAMTEFNADKREIYSYYKGRGLGDMYTNATYRFSNGAWYLAQSEWQDAVGDLDSGYYLREITDYDEKGGSTETVKYYKLVQNPDGSTDFIEVTKAEVELHKNDKRSG